MLPKKNRLSKRGIEEVFRNGRNFRGEFLLFRNLKNSEITKESKGRMPLFRNLKNSEIIDANARKLSKRTIFKESEPRPFVKERGKLQRGRMSILEGINQSDIFKEEESISRFAVIVPVNVSKKASKRNKIKRLMRESLRKKLPKLKPGFDGIFMALPGILGKDYREIEEEIEKLLIDAQLTI